jgi:signal transduction histidine kinase
MAPTEHPELSDYLADDIRDHADALVEEWIEWIVNGISIRPARMLPRDAIRDHIPSVVRGLSEAMRGPVAAVAMALEAIKTHGRMRYDQGFDIEELLKEYHGLGRFVRDRVYYALERYPGDANPLQVGRILFRLSEGLAKITDLTVGVYRKTEAQQQRELHQQLQDYVQTITHELKQPLNAITAGAGMLEHRGDDIAEDKRERYLGIIRDGIERTVNLIDDIRTLVLVEGAQQHEAWQPLESAVHLVLREMGEQARRHDVRIKVVEPLPRIDVDLTRVEIALVNMISNAIKYADPEKPERHVEIEVAPANPNGNRWEIRVSDNGLGISREVQPQIFERHFRAHPHVGAGTGLGLAITRQLIEQAGGRVWFESREGEGSTFHFVVPAYVNETAGDGTPRLDERSQGEEP